MRKLLVLALVLGLVGVAAAYDLGARLPQKATPVVPENVPSGERQGGDDVWSATPIGALPFNDSGTTGGFSDDYDEICPYSGSTSPDVVYSLNAAGTWAITVDLCGSSYDTKAYIYDANFNLIACNDDFYYDSTCGYYTSLIEDAVCTGLVYIVVDGYYGAWGNYLLEVTGGPFVPCDIICAGTAEGEPPLQDGYSDNYNGGCNSAGYPFQNITGDYAGAMTLCGVSGWYLFNGSNYRDTDWFILTVGPAGMIEITADAEQPLYIFELGPRDCASVGVLQLATAGDCAPASMTIVGAHNSSVWFWAGPTAFVAPPGAPNMFDYVVYFTGLSPALRPRPRPGAL